MAVPMATRYFLHGRTRLVIGVGGIALAALLVLVLDGVFAGSAKQVTVFMDRTPFDVVVSQSGVKNLHMTTSFFADEKVRQVRRVEGVASADRILFTSAFLIAGDGSKQRALSYLIGYEPGGLGGPWEWAGPEIRPADDEIVLDERTAADLGVGVGDTITAAGSDFRIAALDAGTTSIVNSIAFVSFDGFQKAQRLRGVTSFALVRATPGVAPDELVRRIDLAVSDVTVQTREEFAGNERRIVSDMSIDIMRMMNLIAFLIGLSVTALATYTATVGVLKEYGIMKAVGAGSVVLYGVVLRQALMSLLLGLGLALALALLLQEALVRSGASIPMAVELSSIVKVVLGAAVIGPVSALVPIARIAGLKPAEVFRR